MTVQTARAQRLISLLAIVFFTSGFTSLLYQVTWQRLLTIYYGVGSISITLIVSVYMFGLGTGAFVGGYLADRAKNGIQLYFRVELLLGCFGLISFPCLLTLGRYTAGSSYAISLVYMFLFLCLPTFLMGMTLPLLTKIFSRLIPDFLYCVSFLYFINTLGASFGAIFASYIVISFFGLDTGIYLAAALNFILAALLLLARRLPEIPTDQASTDLEQENQGLPLRNWIYLLVFVAGFLAIGYEIIWFRVIGVLVKASPYTFSSTLSVYLLGIALGSFWMSKRVSNRSIANKQNLFFLLQLLIAVSVMIEFLGYYYLTKTTSLAVLTSASFAINEHPSLALPSVTSIREFLLSVFTLTDVFAWPMIFLLLPTFLMGASFPLLASLAWSRKGKEGTTIGTVYLFNVFGNVLGGVITGFYFLPILGSTATLLVFVSMGTVSGFFVAEVMGQRFPHLLRGAAVVLLIALAVLLLPPAQTLYRSMHRSPGARFDFYFEEGIDGVIATFEDQGRVINYINGHPHGGRPGYKFYREALETLTLAPQTETVLIIGYGTGSILETVLKTNAVKNVTVVELNSTLIRNLGKMSVFQQMLADKRVELVIDDGRRFLLRTEAKYDVIMMDPLRTTTSYSNNLYSRQFFELVQQHLNSDGVLLVWTDEFRIIPKTVSSVFENTRLYSYFILASNGELVSNEYRRQEILAGFPPLAQRRITKFQVEDWGDKSDIRALSSGYPINQDWKPWCEYFIGLEIATKAGIFAQRP